MKDLNVRKEAFVEIVDFLRQSNIKGVQKEMARCFNITPGAISQWKRTGIPEQRLPLVALKFPHLKICKHLHF